MMFLFEFSLRRYPRLTSVFGHLLSILLSLKLSISKKTKNSSDNIFSTISCVEKYFEHMCAQAKVVGFRILSSDLFE